MNQKKKKKKKSSRNDFPELPLRAQPSVSLRLHHHDSSSITDEHIHRHCATRAITPSQTLQHPCRELHSRFRRRPNHRSSALVLTLFVCHTLYFDTRGWLFIVQLSYCYCCCCSSRETMSYVFLMSKE